MTQMQPYQPPLLPCKFCSYACQWCSKSPSQLCSVNIINAQTEPAGLVANTVAVPRHQQLMHPLVRKLPHQEGDSMSLQMVPLCHSLFILEVLFALLKCMQSRHLAVGVKYQGFQASVP